jgi:hypothetical protein
MNFPYSRVTIFAGPLHNLNLKPKKARSKFSSSGFFHETVFPGPPVINLYFRISPEIFVKFRNGPNGILGGNGEIDEKNPEVENHTSDYL